MGLLATWIFQLTRPFRQFRTVIDRLKKELFRPFLTQRRIGEGVVRDVQGLKKSAGFGKKPPPPS